LAAWLRWRRGEVQAGLEAAGGDGVGPVADLDAEPVLALGQHAVGAIVEQLQRWHVAVLSYQDRRGTQQVGRQLVQHVSSPCTVVPCHNGFGSTQFVWLRASATHRYLTI
jgi:hypothetical protein